MLLQENEKKGKENTMPFGVSLMRSIIPGCPVLLQADSMSMTVITTTSAMIAVCRSSTDIVIESEELDAPNKLFQMCQAVVQRYYMYGRPVNPGSAACGPWADFRQSVAQIALRRQLGKWTGDRSTWYRLVTNSSVKALDNLLSVLEKNRQVTFSLIADVCMLI